MITLTKLNGTEFTLNSDLIETIAENHDTIVKLENKNYYTVQESMSEIVEKVVSFRCATLENFTASKVGK